MIDVLLFLTGVVLGGFTSAWVLALVTVVRATAARKDGQ